MENFCQRHNITSFNSFCAICLSECAAQLPTSDQIDQYEPYQPREQDLGQHIMMDIEEVDLANILDYVFLSLIMLLLGGCTSQCGPQEDNTQVPIVRHWLATRILSQSSSLSPEGRPFDTTYLSISTVYLCARVKCGRQFRYRIMHGPRLLR